MNTIAIDCGASYVKGALIIEGKIIKEKRMKAPTVHMNEPITVPVQIDALLNNVTELIRCLSESESEVNLCLSNEMHGFLLADEDGKPVTDYISWQKEYGGEKIDNISSIDILSSEEYKECILKTGMALRAGLPSSNLLYLKRKGIFNNDALYFYTLGDFLIRNFTGEEILIHPTNAAGTGLVDVLNMSWESELIKLCAPENVIFPKIGTEKNTIDKFGCRFHVFPALGDQQAALLGAGVDKIGDISFNLGTGAQVSVISINPEYDENYQVRPYFNGLYLKTVPHIPSGRALNVYYRFISSIFSKFDLHISDDEIWKKFVECGNSSGKIKTDLSFFENAITNHTTGSISNIGEFEFTFDNLMYSIQDQMAENCIQAAKRITNINEIKHVFFSGGVSKKFNLIRKLIMKYFSDSDCFIAENETLIGLYKYGNI